MKKFYEMAFLSKLYQNDLNLGELEESKIKSIERFFIFWNLFEKLGFDEHFSYHESINSATGRVKINGLFEYFNTPINLGILGNILLYYKERYIDEYPLTNLSIQQRESAIRNELQEYLSGFDSFLNKDNAYKKKGVELIIFLIWRYRNNLFHGNKNPYNLHHQDKNFNVANRFLGLCIQYFASIIIISCDAYNNSGWFVSLAGKQVTYLFTKEDAINFSMAYEYGDKIGIYEDNDIREINKSN